jgi:hypothetical protein
MRNAFLGPDYWIVPVALSQIMSDYGGSLGEFAMEKGAFNRFRAAATEATVVFETETDPFHPELIVVAEKGVQMQDDD